MEQVQLLWMLEYWDEVWERLIHNYSPVPPFLDIVKQYSEPHRFYHILEHIRYGWELIDEYQQATGLPQVSADLIRFAFAYHDFYYAIDLHAENEMRSAMVARTVLKFTGISDSICAAVASMIRDTTHKEPPISPLGAILVDVDLAILGAPFHEYWRDYAHEKIEKEYCYSGKITEHEFSEGRVKFLEKFLALHPPEKPIYNTEYFRNKFEEQARKNIVQEISLRNLYLK